MRALAIALVLLSSPQRPLDRAREMIAKGSARGAIEILRPIVRAEPRNADARLLLGTALAVGGRRSESIAQLNEAVRLRPNSATAYNTLGMALGRFVETSAARAAFEKAIRLDPGLAGARVNLALLLAQSHEWDLAREHLDRAIEIQSTARAYCLRARVHNEQHHPEAALADLERAVRLQPDYAEAWYELGVTRHASLDEAGALSAFEQVIRLDPANGGARFRLGSAYLRSGKPRQAIEHLREALRLDPDNRAALYNLQMALRRDGRIDEAKQAETRMTELLRNNSRISEMSIQAVKLNNRAVELEKAGDLRGAIEKYQAALELDPSHSGFRLNYGLALCRLGRWDEGITELREILRRDPDNAEAARALYIALEQQPGKP